jgi:hypothetical protein
MLGGKELRLALKDILEVRRDSLLSLYSEYSIVITSQSRQLLIRDDERNNKLLVDLILRFNAGCKIDHRICFVAGR